MMTKQAAVQELENNSSMAFEILRLKRKHETGYPLKRLDIRTRTVECVDGEILPFKPVGRPRSR